MTNKQAIIEFLKEKLADAKEEYDQVCSDEGRVHVGHIIDFCETHIDILEQ